MFCKLIQMGSRYIALTERGPGTLRTTRIANCELAKPGVEEGLYCTFVHVCIVFKSRVTCQPTLVA
jgi:hypothetical protein